MAGITAPALEHDTTTVRMDRNTILFGPAAKYVGNFILEKPWELVSMLISSRKMAMGLEDEIAFLKQQIEDAHAAVTMLNEHADAELQFLEHEHSIEWAEEATHAATFTQDATYGLEKLVETYQDAKDTVDQFWKDLLAGDIEGLEVQWRGLFVELAMESARSMGGFEMPEYMAAFKQGSDGLYHLVSS